MLLEGQHKHVVPRIEQRAPKRKQHHSTHPWINFHESTTHRTGCICLSESFVLVATVFLAPEHLQNMAAAARWPTRTFILFPLNPLSLRQRTPPRNRLSCSRTAVCVVSFAIKSLQKVSLSQNLVIRKRLTRSPACLP